LARLLADVQLEAKLSLMLHSLEMRLSHRRQFRHVQRGNSFRRGQLQPTFAALRHDKSIAELESDIQRQFLTVTTIAVEPAIGAA
jgi:hypothetical protein